MINKYFDYSNTCVVIGRNASQLSQPHQNHLTIAAFSSSALVCQIPRENKTVRLNATLLWQNTEEMIADIVVLTNRADGQLCAHTEENRIEASRGMGCDPCATSRVDEAVQERNAVEKTCDIRVHIDAYPVCVAHTDMCMILSSVVTCNKHFASLSAPSLMLNPSLKPGSRGAQVAPITCNNGTYLKRCNF